VYVQKFTYIVFKKLFGIQLKNGSQKITVVVVIRIRAGRQGNGDWILGKYMKIYSSPKLPDRP
jgi:hypothetical protein